MELYKLKITESKIDTICGQPDEVRFRGVRPNGEIVTTIGKKCPLEKFPATVEDNPLGGQSFGETMLKAVEYCEDTTLQLSPGAKSPDNPIPKP